MPRPRAFQVDDVLSKATDVFWRKGYGGSSIQDLVSATGLNKGSLYGAFVDKHTLFRESLRHYQNSRAPLFARTQEPLEDLKVFFATIVEETCDPERCGWGCFIMNTSMELESQTTEIRELIAEALCGLEDWFLGIIEDCRTKGLIPETVEPRRAARILLSAAFSIKGIGKSRPDPELLGVIADSALAALRIS